MNKPRSRKDGASQAAGKSGQAGGRSRARSESPPVSGDGKTTRKPATRSPRTSATQEALRQSEQRYKSFIAQSTEGIWRFELAEPIPITLPVERQVEIFLHQARLAECNESFAQMYGYPSCSDVVGKWLHEFLPPEDPRNITYLRSFIESGYRLLDAESQEVDRFGRPRTMLNNLTGVVEDGKLVRAWGTQRDVTEIRQVRADLERYRLIADHARDIVLFFRLFDGRILEANRSAEEAYGYSREELLRMSVYELRSPDELAGAADQMSRAHERGLLFETTHRRKDGTSLPVEVSARGETLQGEQVVVSIIRDISGRRSVESALRASERRLRLALASARAGVWERDLIRRQSTWTAEMFDVYGLPRGAAIPTLEQLEKRVHPDDRVQAMALIQQAMRDGGPFELEFRLVLNGETRWVHSCGEVELDASGRPCAARGIDQDITSRKRIEDAANVANAQLRASDMEQRRLLASLSLALQSAEAGTFDWDVRKNLNILSRELEALYGFAPGEFGGRHEDWMDTVLPEDRPAAMAAVSRSLQTGLYEVEFRIRRRSDGEIRWMQARGRVTFDSLGNPLRMVGINIDTTARRMTEAALRESEARKSAILDAALDAIITADAQGVIMEFNPAAEAMFGYQRSEVLGKNLADTIIPPASREAFLAGLSRFHESGQARMLGRRMEMVAMRSSREEFPCELAISAIMLSGQPTLFTAQLRDITQQKEAAAELERHRTNLEQMVEARTQELQQTYERLRTSERLASLGTLSAGLGHDMGNLLVPIRIRLESLERLDLPPEGRADLQGIRASTEYLRRLANGLGLLSMDPRRSQAERATELLGWWADASGVLRNALPRPMKLESRLPQQECWVAIARTALTQVIFNLVQNAGDAMRERGWGKVKIDVEELPDGVRVTVEDDGPGMPDEVRRRCMEPFFTTKSRGISTGLGLALVFGLLKEAGATVQIRSELGAGTKFDIWLPAGAPSANKLPGAGLRACVCMQDVRLRAFLIGELRNLGCEVQDSCCGPDIAVLDAHAAHQNDDLHHAANVLVVGSSTDAEQVSGGLVTSSGSGVRELRQALQSLIRTAQSGAQLVAAHKES